MAERLHRSADVPDFNSYPNEPLLPENVTGMNGKTALEEKARQMGHALGRTVVTLREAQQAVKDIGSMTRDVAAIRITDASNRARAAGAKVTEMGEALKQKATQWSTAAAGNAEELRQSALEKGRNLGSQLRTGYYRTRLRANQTVREYPVHFVLLAGLAGFLLGAGLRIWRSSREY